MNETALSSDLTLKQDEGIATLTIHRPPENFLDAVLVTDLASALESLDRDRACRAIILASEGKHFCAGANVATLAGTPGAPARGHIYGAAHRLVATRKPIVAALQGAAIGAGFGLALLADFRVGCDETRLSANFNRQGYYPGFGMTFTLPRLVGKQLAAWLFYSGQRVKGQEALAMGLIDRLVARQDLMVETLGMAREIAASGPQAVQAMRLTLREGFEAGFTEAIHKEMEIQDALRKTSDFQEGVRAMAERRLPVFKGE